MQKSLIGIARFCSGAYSFDSLLMMKGYSDLIFGQQLANFFIFARINGVINEETCKKKETYSAA